MEFASIEEFKATLPDYRDVEKIVNTIKEAIEDGETKAFVDNGLAFVIEVLEDVRVYTIECASIDEAIIHV